MRAYFRIESCALRRHTPRCQYSTAIGLIRMLDVHALFISSPLALFQLLNFFFSVVVVILIVMFIFYTLIIKIKLVSPICSFILTLVC